MGTEEKTCKIKVCGMMRPEDIRYVNTLLPDYAGFVFAKGFRHTITVPEGKALQKELDRRILSVGVFVDDDINLVAGLYKEEVIGLAQLHGREDEEYIRRLRECAPGLKIIRTFIVRSREDLKEAEKSTADHILLDAGSGSGRTFDRTLIEGFKRPYYLAGGLNENNIAEAIRTSPGQLFGVDVSSGVETDGKKDYEKMPAFS